MLVYNSDLLGHYRIDVAIDLDIRENIVNIALNSFRACDKSDIERQKYKDSAEN